MHDMNEVQDFVEGGSVEGRGKSGSRSSFPFKLPNLVLGGHCGLKIRAVEWISRMEDCDVSLMA